MGCREGGLLLVLEFGLKYAYEVVDGVFLEVRLFNEGLTWSVEHALCGHTAYVLQCVDYPSVDFVLEFVKVDVLLEGLFSIAVHVYDVSCEH